jgi:hypothetical protein
MHVFYRKKMGGGDLRCLVESGARLTINLGNHDLQLCLP